jgi:hypothetical protein
LIAGLDTRFGAGPARVDVVGEEHPTLFNPFDPVVRRGYLAFRLEVEPGKDHRCHRQQKEQDGNKASLAFAVHRACAASLTPGMVEAGKYPTLLLCNFAATSSSI